MSSASADLKTAITEASVRLLRAEELRQPCAPVRDLIGADDVEAAYAVQQEIVNARLACGARVVGRKIGLTAPAVQRQLGVDRPDFGVLFADMQYPEGAAVPMARLMQPKVEAEIAFVLSRDLDDSEAGPAGVRDAVEYAVAALEIVDSRIERWDITFGDTVADNASTGLFVLGTRHVSLDEFRPVDAEMSMTFGGEVASTGNGAACLGDPLNALAWLAATARDLGDPLRAGQVVLSGALGPMMPVSVGVDVVADITGLGTVSAVFG
jgi:2-keto-4-pentenoate hydratase